MNKKKYTRAALVVSMVLVIVWSIMGTGTSLAWFTDTDEEVKNVFHFADFDLDAEYRTEKGEWKSIEGETAIFDDKALYEPGYVQVVYLRVTNKGEVPFTFKTAVNVTDYNEPINVLGQKFHLHEHLRFGLTKAVATEQEMDELVRTRELARSYANEELNNYATEDAQLAAGATVYMALVVQMPEEVDNVANYWGETIPRVELGLIVSATQLKD